VNSWVVKFTVAMMLRFEDEWMGQR
jgi:hypothetical protein